MSAQTQVPSTTLRSPNQPLRDAGAMLCQHRAAAVVGARSKIVEGAVGMVRM